MNGFKIDGFGVYEAFCGLAINIVKRHPIGDGPECTWSGQIDNTPGVPMDKFVDRLERFDLRDLWGEMLTFDERGNYDGEDKLHPLGLLVKRVPWSQRPAYAISGPGKYITRDARVVVVESTQNASADGYPVVGHTLSRKVERYTWRTDGTHHTDPTAAHALDIIYPYSKSRLERRLLSLQLEMMARQEKLSEKHGSPLTPKDVSSSAFDEPDDPINHPAHYTGHPSGVECIQITEHMNFCRGNAMKYIWRAGEKGDELEDLKKARWYLDREIARLSAT